MSLRMHSEQRCIEAGGLAHGFQLPVPGIELPESTRNTSASRNRYNSSVFNDLTFSTRNKIEGPTRTVALPALTQEGSDPWESKGSCSFLIISNRNNPGNRNRGNSLSINDLIFSNRNKIGG